MVSFLDFIIPWNSCLCSPLNWQLEVTAGSDSLNWQLEVCKLYPMSEWRRQEGGWQDYVRRPTIPTMATIHDHEHLQPSYRTRPIIQSIPKPIPVNFILIPVNTKLQYIIPVNTKPILVINHRINIYIEEKATKIVFKLENFMSFDRNSYAFMLYAVCTCTLQYLVTWWPWLQISMCNF